MKHFGLSVEKLFFSRNTEADEEMNAAKEKLLGDIKERCDAGLEV